MKTYNKKKTIIDYFKYFNDQDTRKLCNIFSQNIRLKDWNIDVKGRTNVINANKKIFKKFPNIKVRVKKIYYFQYEILTILRVKLNNKKTIDVIDKFKVNKSNLISHIRAYLG